MHLLPHDCDAGPIDKCLAFMSVDEVNRLRRPRPGLNFHRGSGTAKRGIGSEWRKMSRNHNTDHMRTITAEEIENKCWGICKKRADRGRGESKNEDIGETGDFIRRER